MCSSVLLPEPLAPMTARNCPAGTSSVLLLPNVSPSQAGSYSVVITNVAGSTNSATVLLSVYASAVPALSGASQVAGGQFQFSVTGVPGYDYVVAASTNLLDWKRYPGSPIVRGFLIQQIKNAGNDRDVLLFLDKAARDKADLAWGDVPGGSDLPPRSHGSS